MDLSALEPLQSVLQILAALSALTFCISILCIPLLVARLPTDYFSLSRKPRSGTARTPTATTLVVLLLRNTIGLLLVFAGIVMLFLPGQGLITMVIGIAVMSFPYKRRLLSTFTRPPSVRKSLNWIRTKMKKEPFYW